MKMKFEKPRIVISKCMGFEKCRWNGISINEPAVELLTPYVEYITVCPEMEIGLGAPREPIRLVKKNDKILLLQSETEKNVTDDMKEFSEKFLDSLEGIDGFFLKFRSPSCGMANVKVYPSLGKVGAMSNKGKGLFAEKVMEKFPDLPREDEGRLRNFKIREHYFTGIFTNARYRKVKESGRMKDLVKFHSENKFLLMAYNQKEMRNLGRIVGNHEKKPFEQVVQEYETHLANAMARAPRFTTSINVLMHALGFFSDDLSAEEKSFFLDSLEQYRAAKVPLSVPVSLIRSWIIRFGEEYLESQTFFEPYPSDLVEITDSGKGRTLKK